MLSASHREREATMRHCLALIDSGYSLAADTDLAVYPGVLSLWLPWCLKYAFVLTTYEFDTSVLKLHLNPLRGWALQRADAVQAVTIFSDFLCFKDTNTITLTTTIANNIKRWWLILSLTFPPVVPWDWRCWFWVRCLNRNWMDYHAVWSSHSCPPQNEL